ncbi:MAG: hypothetical protein KC492_42315, partial [Myxococcales bacterium]|nr:hypothetical protein [Myxococcales bacterium]
MLRIGLGLLFFGGAVACGSADGSSSTIGSSGQGGAGGTSGNAGGNSSIGASGGTGGEALDCPGHAASGELDGESTLTASSDLHGVSSLTNTWQVSTQISDFHAWAWGTTLEPVPSGVAHFRSDAGTHYCSAEARWSQPYMSGGSRGEITYSRFSTLGSCAGVSGATTELE